MTTKNIQRFTQRGGNYRYFVVAVLIGLAAIVPCLLWGFPVGADFDNHMRFALPLYDELNRGNFLPGWLAESNDGFGDPRFRFYPPFLYYVLCAFRFVTGDWFRASIAAFGLFSVIGTVGVYRWARLNLPPNSALVAAGLFAFMPYHLAQFYQASLLAEFAAASFLPFAFAAVERIMTESGTSVSRRMRSVAVLAAAYSLVATTHLPTTVIGSLSLGVFSLLLTDWRSGWRRLFFCAGGIALGILASLWFLGRMFPELGWIQAGHNVSSDYYDYRNNFSFSPWAPSNRNTFYASLLTALTIAILVPALAFCRQLFFPKIGDDEPTGARAKRGGLAVTFVISVLAVLMTTDLSRPVWAIVPKLKDVQFPYRWLSIASVAAAPVIAAAFPVWSRRLTERSLRPLHFAVLAIFLGAFSYSLYELAVESNFLKKPEMEERLAGIRGARSFNDWLPVGAFEIKDVKPMKEPVEVGEQPGDIGERRAEIKAWESHRRIFTVSAGETNLARIKTYYYPLWRAYDISRAGERTPLKASAAGDGAILVQLPPTEATIEVVFEEPPRTRVGVIVSLFAWILIAVSLATGLVSGRAAEESPQ